MKIDSGAIQLLRLYTLARSPGPVSYTHLLSALCGYEELNDDKRLLPDGATLLDRSRFTYGGAIHSSVELFLTDNLLFVLKAQGRLLFGSDLHRFRPAISAGLKFNI